MVFICLNKKKTQYSSNIKRQYAIDLNNKILTVYITKKNCNTKYIRKEKKIRRKIIYNLELKYTLGKKKKKKHMLLPDLITKICPNTDKKKHFKMYI